MDDAEDFLADAATLLGNGRPSDDGIQYGPLVLTVAPKEGKANTLLADHLFSPSLLLAELIERRVISLSDKAVVELGAVVITDYPDPVIMRNIIANLARNVEHSNCQLCSIGYEWGQDVRRVQKFVEKRNEERGIKGIVGYDAVIMSDLLHFDRSHDVLARSLASLLRRDAAARAYVAAGKYTKPHVCDNFVQEARRLGVVLEEQEVESTWMGTMRVSGGGLDAEQLSVRKNMCRWWIGRWEHL